MSALQMEGEEYTYVYKILNCSLKYLKLFVEQWITSGDSRNTKGLNWCQIQHKYMKKGV